MSQSINTARQKVDCEPFYMEAFIRLQEQYGEDHANQVVGSMLVKYASNAMTNKLKQYSRQAHKNWWRDDLIDIDHLKEAVAFHIEEGEYLDASILAMMVHARECAIWEAQE